MNNDHILLLSTLDQEAITMKETDYILIRDTIIELFLFESQMTLDDIILKAGGKLQSSLASETLSFVKHIVADLESKDSLEQISGSDPAVYRLKLIVC